MIGRVQGVQAWELLDAAGDHQRALAKQDVREAGAHAASAVTNTFAAGVNVVGAAVKVVMGTAQAVRSAGRITAAAGIGVIAAGVSVIEDGFKGPLGGAAPAASKHAQPAQAQHAQAMQQAQPCEPARGLRWRPSEALLRTADRFAQGAQTDLQGAGDSFGDAAKRAVGAVANVAFGIGHAIGSVGNVFQAGGRAQWAAGLELFEWDARFGAAVGEAAQDGRELNWQQR